jgi:hypothetical protein
MASSFKHPLTGPSDHLSPEGRGTQVLKRRRLSSLGSSPLWGEVVRRAGEGVIARPPRIRSQSKSLFDRRDFLRAAGAGFLTVLSPSAFSAALSTDAVFATAFQKRDGSYGAAILSEQGKLLHSVDLPERGHDITFDPASKRSVVFARQPGTFAVVFDHAGKSEPLTITSVEGRHFYGHGVFSPDGALLYATENDFDNAAGMVGIYDARDHFRRIGEFSTHGVGPGSGRRRAVLGQHVADEIERAADQHARRLCRRRPRCRATASAHWRPTLTGSADSPASFGPRGELVVRHAGLAHRHRHRIDMAGHAAERR